MLAVGDHGEPELVDNQQPLRQSVLADDLGQPLRNQVDLHGVNGADVSKVHLLGFEPQLRIQLKTDMGQPQELLVDSGLREEIGSAWLQIQHDVHSVGGCRLDPGPDQILGGLVRVFPVIASGGNGGDDLERRQYHQPVGFAALGY